LPAELRIPWVERKRKELQLCTCPAERRGGGQFRFRAMVCAAHIMVLSFCLLRPCVQCSGWAVAGGVAAGRWVAHAKHAARSETETETEAEKTARLLPTEKEKSHGGAGDRKNLSKCRRPPQHSTAQHISGRCGAGTTSLSPLQAKRTSYSLSVPGFMSYIYILAPAVHNSKSIPSFHPQPRPPSQSHPASAACRYPLA
jgi:hypothetical protein